MNAKRPSLALFVLVLPVILAIIILYDAGLPLGVNGSKPKIQAANLVTGVHPGRTALHPTLAHRRGHNGGKMASWTIYRYQTGNDPNSGATPLAASTFSLDATSLYDNSVGDTLTGYSIPVVSTSHPGQVWALIDLGSPKAVTGWEFAAAIPAIIGGTALYYSNTGLAGSWTNADNGILTSTSSSTRTFSTITARYWQIIFQNTTSFATAKATDARLYDGSGNVYTQPALPSALPAVPIAFNQDAIEAADRLSGFTAANVPFIVPRRHARLLVDTCFWRAFQPEPGDPAPSPPAFPVWRQHLVTGRIQILGAALQREALEPPPDPVQAVTPKPVWRVRQAGFLLSAPAPAMMPEAAEVAAATVPAFLRPRIRSFVVPGQALSLGAPPEADVPTPALPAFPVWRKRTTPYLLPSLGLTRPYCEVPADPPPNALVAPVWRLRTTPFLLACATLQRVPEIEGPDPAPAAVPRPVWGTRAAPYLLPNIAALARPYDHEPEFPVPVAPAFPTWKKRTATFISPAWCAAQESVRAADARDTTGLNLGSDSGTWGYGFSGGGGAFLGWLMTMDAAMLGMPPVPPPTPDDIDTALTYTIDTGRTSTWEMTGHVYLETPIYAAEGGGVDVNPILVDTGVFTYPLPGGRPEVRVTLGDNNPGESSATYLIQFQIGGEEAVFPDLVHDPQFGLPNQAKVGLQVNLFGKNGSFGSGFLTVNGNIGSYDVVSTHPGLHAPYAPGYVFNLTVIKADTDFTITVNVKEQFISQGRHAGAYQWVPTHINVVAGDAVMDAAIPAQYQQAIDSYLTAQVDVLAQGAWAGTTEWLTTGDYARLFSDGWAYLPAFRAKLSDWHLSGTLAGTDFTGFGGTLPKVSGAGGGRWTLDSRSLETAIDTTYGSAATNGGILVAQVFGIAPPCAQTITLPETWWDNTALTRDPASEYAVAIAATISAWNAQVAQYGSIIAFETWTGGIGTFETIGAAGPATGNYFYPANHTLEPLAMIGSHLPIGHQAYNAGTHWYVKNTGDPFYTGNLGRAIGNLALTAAVPDLPDITLAVATASDGSNATATVTEDLGNWAAARYLTFAVAGMLTAGRAYVTVTTADGRTADYTLKAGVSRIDLANPDDVHAATLGVGAGLTAPIPAFASNGLPAPDAGYRRVSGDVSTPAASSHVTAIRLTVTAPSQTLTLSDLALSVTAAGYDAWVDPKFPVSPGAESWRIYAYELSKSAFYHVPVHVPPQGRFNLLSDGKMALTYPAFGKLPNAAGYKDHAAAPDQDYWDIATMLADLYYDLRTMDNGLGMNFLQTFVPPNGLQITMRNVPIGMVSASNVPYGETNYRTWTEATSLPVSRELIRLTVPVFCAVYHLEGAGIHGGGLEGIALDYGSATTFTGSLKITHDPGVLYQDPITGFPGIVTTASNPPTGSVSVPCDANGFFRSIFYEHYETPHVTRQVNAPIPVPPDFPPATLDMAGRPIPRGVISELTYNHFVALITTVVPRIASIGPGDGSYHVAGVLYSADTPSGIAYWRCDTGCPLPGVGWDTAASVISNNPLDTAPCLAQDARGRLYCQFQRLRVAAGVYESVSDDDGQTWGVPVLSAIANGQYPIIRSGHDGSLYRAAYVDDGTGMETGTLMGQWQASGDVSPPLPVTFVKTDGTAIAVQAGSFDMTHLVESAGRWILAVTEAGATEQSYYVSADDAGGTWVLVT